MEEQKQMPEDEGIEETRRNEERTEGILETAERATDRELLSMQSYKRYPAYRALFELHPKGGLNVEGCLGKAVLYICSWLKEKVNAPEERWPGGLRNLPEIRDGADLVIDEASDLSGIDINEPVRVKTFYWDNCWTLRFNEKNSSFDGEFINNISLTKEKSSVVLAIRTECRQSEASSKRAVALRPGYVSKLMLDEELFLTEKLGAEGADPAFVLPLTKEAVPVNGNSQEAVELYRIMIHPLRNLPLLIIPESGDEEEKKTAEMLYRDEEMDHHGVFGYYTTVYITGGKWNKFLYCAQENQGIRKWISEAVSEGRALLIGPWDGSPDSFRYYVWGEEEEDSGYVTWKEDTKVEECPMFSAELADRIKRLKLSGEPLERRCNFGPYLFNRELWSRYNNKQIEEAREAQNDDELIQSLQKKAEELEKERKALLERVKSTEQLNEELREKNRDLNREKKELQRSAGEPKENIHLREGDSEADRRLESLKKLMTEKAVESGVLFKAQKDWETVLPIVRKELIQRLREGFERLFEGRNKQESPTRREDALGFLYLINLNGEEKVGSEPGVLLKYPASEELYENEYSTLLLETIWRENDPLIAYLAKEKGYNKAWREDLKRNLLNDIDNYRNVASIRAVLGQNGIVPDGGGKHDKWAFHGDDRYTVTIACTPRDRNAGKNVVEDILDSFF